MEVESRRTKVFFNRLRPLPLPAR